MLELGPEGWRTVRPRAWRLVLWCGMIAICSTNIYWGSFKKIKKHKGTHKAISEKCHKFAWMKDYRNWCKEGTDFSCKRIRRTLESSYFRAGKRGKKQSLSIARVRHCVRCFMDRSHVPYTQFFQHDNILKIYNTIYFSSTSTFKL